MTGRVGVLVSGRGSNMAALLAASRVAGYPGEIVQVVCNEPTASGVALAVTAGVSVAILDHRGFADRVTHEMALDRLLRAAGVEIVCLAGYMRVLTPFLVNAWRGRLLNIHPSLLPAFPGLHTHARALAAGVTEHGCTVHQVSEVLDGGAILGQARVPVWPDDTEAGLAARVLDQEHRLYPAVLATEILRLSRELR